MHCDNVLVCAIESEQNTATVVKDETVIEERSSSKQGMIMVWLT